jgi:hypothetical protein
MKLALSLLLSFSIVTPSLAADAIWCIPVEKKVEEKKIAESTTEKPEKKKHKKYEGTKVPDAKK